MTSRITSTTEAWRSRRLFFALLRMNWLSGGDHVDAEIAHVGLRRLRGEPVYTIRSPHPVSHCAIK